MPSVGDALKLSIVITSVDRFSRTLDMINRRIEGMANALNSKAGKAITKFEKEAAKSGKVFNPAFREMYETIEKTIAQAQKLDIIGTSMIRAGMAFGVAAAGIIKVSSVLEDKMSRINAMRFDPFVGLDPDFLDEITSYILELGTRTPIKTEDLAELGIVAAQLGLRGDDIYKFLDVVSMLAAIDPSVSTRQWAEYMGKFRETFHLSNEELDKFGSMLTYLATSTPAKAGEIAAAMFRTGQIATGLLPQDIAAVNTALIQVGMTAERAGTATRRLFIDLADVNKMKKIIALLEFDYDFAEYKSLKESVPDAGTVVKSLYSLASIVPEDKLKEYQILYMKDPLSLLIKVLDQFSTLAKAQGEALETPFDFSQYFEEEDIADIEEFFLGIGDLIQDVGAPIESSLRDIFNIRGTEAVTKLLAQVENIRKIRDLAYKAWPTAMTRSKSIAEYFAESIDQSLIKEEDLNFLTEMLNSVLNNAIETGALETKAGFLETWRAISVIAEPFNIAFDEAKFDEQMQSTLEKFDISVLQEKYNIRTESMASQMLMARNAIIMALYEIGIALKPLVEKIAHMVSSIAKWFAKLPRWLKDGIAYTLVWGAALLTAGGIVLKIMALVLRLKALMMAKELAIALGLIARKVSIISVIGVKSLIALSSLWKKLSLIFGIAITRFPIAIALKKLTISAIYVLKKYLLVPMVTIMYRLFSRLSIAVMPIFLRLSKAIPIYLYAIFDLIKAKAIVAFSSLLVYMKVFIPLIIASLSRVGMLIGTTLIKAFEPMIATMKFVFVRYFVPVIASIKAIMIKNLIPVFITIFGRLRYIIGGLLGSTISFFTVLAYKIVTDFIPTMIIAMGNAARLIRGSLVNAFKFFKVSQAISAAAEYLKWAFIKSFLAVKTFAVATFVGIKTILIGAFEGLKVVILTMKAVIALPFKMGIATLIKPLIAGFKMLGVVALKSILLIGKSLFAVFSLLMAHPVVLIIAGIAAAVIGIIALIKNWEKVTDFLKRAWEGLKSFFRSFADAFMAIFSPIIDWLKNAFGGAFDFILSTLSGIIGMSIKAMKAIGMDVELPDWISTRWAEEQFSQIESSANMYVNRLLEVSDAAKSPFRRMITSAFENLEVDSVETAIEVLKAFNEAAFMGDTGSVEGINKLINTIQDITGLTPNITEQQKAINAIVGSMTSGVASTSIFGIRLDPRVAMAEATTDLIEQQLEQATLDFENKISDLSNSLNTLYKADQNFVSSGLIAYLQDWYNALTDVEKEMAKAYLPTAIMEGLRTAESITGKQMSFILDLGIDTKEIDDVMQFIYNGMIVELPKSVIEALSVIDDQQIVEPTIETKSISRWEELLRAVIENTTDKIPNALREKILEGVPVGNVFEILVGATPNLDMSKSLAMQIGAIKLANLNSIYSELSEAEKRAYQTSIVEMIAKALSDDTLIQSEMESIAEGIMLYLPQSPAKKGPLRKLFESGKKIVGFISSGIMSVASEGQKAMETLALGMTETLDNNLNTQTNVVLSRFFRSLNMSGAINDINTFLRSIYSLESSPIGKTINEATSGALTNIVGLIQSILGGKIGDLSNIISGFGMALGIDLSGLAGIAGPIGIAIAAITTAFSLFGDKQWFKDLTDPIMQTLRSVWDIVVSIFEPIGEFLSNIAPAIGQALNVLFKIGVMMNPMIVTMVTILTLAFNLMNRIFAVAKKIFKPITDMIDEIRETFGTMLEPLKEAFSSLWEALKPLIDFGLDSIIEVILLPLKSLVVMLTPVVKAIAWVVNLISSFFKSIADFINKIVEFISNVYNKLTGKNYFFNSGEEKVPWWQKIFGGIFAPKKNTIEEATTPNVTPIVEKIEENPTFAPQEFGAQSIMQFGTKNFKEMSLDTEPADNVGGNTVIFNNTFNINGTSNPEQIWRFIKGKLDLEALRSR